MRQRDAVNNKRFNQDRPMNIFKLFKRKPKVPGWKAKHPTWTYDRSEAGRRAMATCERLYGGQGKSYASRIGLNGAKATNRKRVKA